jgi:hypothetical protein
VNPKVYGGLLPENKSDKMRLFWNMVAWPLVGDSINECTEL